MALWEVHDEAAHGRQRHQGAGTSMPQLRVDGFLIPCFANRELLIITRIASQVEKREFMN